MGYRVSACALLARNRIRDLSRSVAAVDEQYGTTSILLCQTCEKETLFAKSHCSHDLCVECMSGLVEEALQTTSLPFCKQCDPNTLLRPDFIISMLNMRARETYKLLLVSQINSYHSLGSRAKRFLSRNKLGIAIGVAGFGLMLLIFKLSGGSESFDLSSEDPPPIDIPAGEEETVWQIKDVVTSLDMVKDILLSVDAWKASRPARSAGLEKAVSSYSLSFFVQTSFEWGRSTHST